MLFSTILSTVTNIFSEIRSYYADKKNANFFTKCFQNSEKTSPALVVPLCVVDRKNHYVRIYINNILYREYADPYSSFNNNNEDLKIGWSQAGSSSLPFKGSLDELRLYNRVLSESEIRELYKNGKDSCQIWDINNDGRTGLEEAIHALQIAAGIN